MKSILSVCVIVFVLLKSAWATDYYVSVSGSDSRTATEATNPATPWKTISKINSYFVNFKPGDRILFKRGETFYGTLKITKSGTSTAPITIGAYGTGNKPVITAFLNMGSWVSKGNGIYESYHASLPSVVNIVVMNNIVQQIGRFPNANATNKGYLTFEAHGTNAIYDNQLTSSPSWTGAEVVVRSSHWTIDRRTVTSHSGTKISFSSPLTYTAWKNFGYFFQNHIRTLDQPGEWYYNPSTKKLSIYSGSTAPSNVKASSANFTIHIYRQSNIVVRDVRIEGANEANLKVEGSTNIQVNSCDIYFAGFNGARVSGTTNIRIENCIVFESNNDALDLRTNVSYSVIKNNNINNTGTRAGMGGSATDTYQGIIVNGGTNHTIEDNRVTNTGFIPVRFDGSYVTVKNNFISNFCFVKDDGSGIYTFNGPRNTWVQRKIIGNIVLNGIGANEGTDKPGYLPTEGIYLDDNVTNVEITGNTVANCTRGIYIHNASYIKIYNNTLYDNDIQQDMNHDNLGDAIRNNVIVGNIFFSKEAEQTASKVRSIANDISSMARFDSNYYCRPFDDWMVISSTYVNSSGTRIDAKHDLRGWQQSFSEDWNSRKSPLQVKDYKVNSLIGSNKFTNGSFTSNVSGVYPSGCTTLWNNSNVLDGGSMEVSTSSSASKSSLSIAIGALSSTKTYVLRFTAKASKDVDLGAYLRLGPSPYTALTSTVFRKISSSRNEFEIVFRYPKGASSANIMLTSTTTSAKYWIDNVALYEADITMLSHASLLRFEYNETNSNKTVALDGSYIDSKGRTYSNSITLAPFESAVLIRTSGTASAAPTAAPTVSITSPTVNAVYNAPASIRLTAAASVSGATISKVEFYRGTTLITTEKYAPYDWTWNNVPAGSYSIMAKAYASNGTITTSTAVPVTVRSTSAAMVERFNDGLTSDTTYAMNLYPNPATTSLQVEINGTTENERVGLQIINATGNVLQTKIVALSGRYLRLNVANLLSGMYYLTINGSKGILTKSFLKQ